MNFNRNGSMNNVHSVEKTMQKFQQLAKDAQSNGDPVLIENYLQHADHFTRVMSEQEASRKERFVASKPIENESSAVEKSTDNKSSTMEKSTIVDEVSKDEVVKKAKVVTEAKKIAKSETKAI